MKTLSLATLILLAAAPTAILANDVADRTPPEKAPSAMTSTEIAQFNKGLPENHPYFIRCRKIVETGSLVKKARICRTNEGWKAAFAQGNDTARESAEAYRQGAQNSN